MGCKESRERVPHPAYTKGSELSVRYDIARCKSAKATSIGVTSASPGCVDEVCPMGRQTSSTSQCTVRSLHSRHAHSPSFANSASSRAVGSEKEGDTNDNMDSHDYHSKNGSKNVIVGVCDVKQHGKEELDNAHSPPSANQGASNVKPVAGATKPAILGRSTIINDALALEHIAPRRYETQGEGLTSMASSPRAVEKHLIVPPSPVSRPASMPAITPLRDFPKPVAVPSAVVPAAEVATSLLLLLPPPAPSTYPTISVNNSNGDSVDCSLRQCETNGVINNDTSFLHLRGELSATNTTVNSASFLNTVTSTQPPSVQGSRSASVQSALTPAFTAAAPTTPEATLSATWTHSNPRSTASRFQPSSLDKAAAEPIDMFSPNPSRTSQRLAKGTTTATMRESQASRYDATSDEFSYTMDGRSTKSTQPSSARTEKRPAEGKPKGAALTTTSTAPSPTSSSPPPQSTQQQQGYTALCTRSSCSLTASPRPCAPHLLSSLQLPCSPPAALYVSDVVADGSDAPHDVPLPKIEDFFVVSPMRSTTTPAHGNSNNTTNLHSGAYGGGNSCVMIPLSSVESAGIGDAPSPWRNRGGSPRLLSPAGPSVTLSENESYGTNNNSNSNNVSITDVLGTTSSFTIHLHGHSNVCNSYGLASGNVGWLVTGNVDNAGISGTGAGSSFYGSGGNNGDAGPNVPGTPPTNSELVRRINQPVTNIKSILRRPASTAAAATTTATSHHCASVATDADSATTTTLGASGVHSCMLSLSLTNPTACAGCMNSNVNGGAPLPGLVMYDGRLSAVPSPLSSIALRTDFITTRHSNSDMDTVSPLGAPYLRGTGALHSPGGKVPPPCSSLGGCDFNNGVMRCPPLSLSSETSSNATVASAVRNNNTKNNSNARIITAAVSSLLFTAAGVVDGNASLSADSGRQRLECTAATAAGGSRSPPSRLASQSSLITPSALPPRRPGSRAPREIPSSGNGGGSAVDVSGSALDESVGVVADSVTTGAVGRTSDEPPPEIILVAPPKRVHLVV